MAEQRFKQHSHLKRLLFDNRVDNSQCDIGILCEHFIKGRPNRGIYKPTLNYEVIHKENRQRRLVIAWEAEFYFNVDKNVHEGDLFGCLKSLSDEIENFALKNKSYFGEAKVRLEENPLLMAELHNVLQELYRGDSGE